MIRPMSQAEIEIIKNMSIKERVSKWKTFLQCCKGANVLPTRREVKRFQNETGKAWEFYQGAIS